MGRLAASVLLAGFVSCTEAPKPATPAIPSEDPDACPAGKRPGDEWPRGECNACTCTEDGKMVCSRMSCTDRDDPL